MDQHCLDKRADIVPIVNIGYTLVFPRGLIFYRRTANIETESWLKSSILCTWTTGFLFNFQHFFVAGTVPSLGRLQKKHWVLFFFPSNATRQFCFRKSNQQLWRTLSIPVEPLIFKDLFKFFSKILSNKQIHDHL